MVGTLAVDCSAVILPVLLWVQVVAKKKLEREAARQSSETIYGASFDKLQKSATAIQASFRGHTTRANVAKIRASKHEAEKKLADVKARRVWLKKHQGPADAETVGTSRGVEISCVRVLGLAVAVQCTVFSWCVVLLSTLLVVVVPCS